MPLRPSRVDSSASSARPSPKTAVVAAAVTPGRPRRSLRLRWWLRPSHLGSVTGKFNVYLPADGGEPRVTMPVLPGSGGAA